MLISISLVSFPNPLVKGLGDGVEESNCLTHSCAQVKLNLCQMSANCRILHCALSAPVKTRYRSADLIRSDASVKDSKGECHETHINAR